MTDDKIRKFQDIDREELIRLREQRYRLQEQVRLLSIQSVVWFATTLVLVAIMIARLVR